MSASKSQSEIWGENLAKVIIPWTQTHGYRAFTAFCNEIGVTKSHVKTAVSTGSSIVGRVGDPTVYARIRVGTGLKESDPRTIPPQEKKTPQGELVEIKQSWEDKQWREWLTSPEAKRMMDFAARHGVHESTEDLLKPSAAEETPSAASEKLSAAPQPPTPIAPPMETTQPLPFKATYAASQLPAASTPSPEAVPFNFEAFMAGVGRTIDGGIAAMQRIQTMEAQITQLTVAVAQLNTLIIQSQQSNGGGNAVSELEGLVGEVLDTIKDLKARNTTPALQPPHHGEQDVSRILEMLLAKLRPLASVRQMTREGRDQFVRTNRNALGELTSIIIPLSSPSDRREESLRLAEEHKL